MPTAAASAASTSRTAVVVVSTSGPRTARPTQMAAVTTAAARHAPGTGAVR